MNIGTNFYTWLSSQAQPLVWGAIIIMALWLAYKREFTKMVGFLVIAIIVVVMVFNTAGFQGILLDIGNKILGAGK